MPTLTIDLPEADYQAAISLSPAELRSALVHGVNRFATAKNKPGELDNVPLSIDDYDETTTEQDLIDIGEGLADVAAGRTHSWQSVYTELKESFKEPIPARTKQVSSAKATQ